MTVEEYIARFPEKYAEKLAELRSLITSVLPDAVEEIKWGVPAYSTTTILVTFAGFATHMNLYVTPSLMDEYRDRCSEWKTGKSAISIPYASNTPRELLTEILLARREEVEAKGVRWM